MTDPDLVAKKLAQIETCVEQLRALAQPARIATDIREQRFIEHSLQIAIQSLLDVASHIVSDERLGEPRTNRELVDLLERGGWLTADLSRRLRNMVGFRNILVHGYEDVDLAIVRDVVERRLGSGRWTLARLDAVARAAGHHDCAPVEVAFSCGVGEASKVRGEASTEQGFAALAGAFKRR